MKPCFNFPALHVRFWYAAGLLAYTFDLIDPITEVAIYAPTGLTVKNFRNGQWQENMSVTEALSKGMGQPDLALPTWHADPGALIRFSIGLDGPILGEVVTPSAPVTDVPHYKCFPTHDEATASFPLSL
jgi:hypothetical protein